MRGVALVVIAKAPAPGRSKTRLCPPCTADEAAQLAAAALEDTLAAVGATPARRYVLALDGELEAPRRASRSSSSAVRALASGSATR